MSLDSAVFLLCFLPLSVALNFLLRGERARNVLLLLLSLLFCAFGSLSGLGLLLAAALVNYGFGLLILRFPRSAGWLAAAAVALDGDQSCVYEMREQFQARRDIMVSRINGASTRAWYG